MDYELRQRVDLILGLADTIDGTPTGLHSSEISLRNCVRTEWLKFLMYLSASDGQISWEESEFIHDYLDFDLDTDGIHQLVLENNIYSEDFENEVPISIQIFAKTDNAYYEATGNKREKDEISVSLLRRMFLALEQELLACDDEITDDEINNLTIYALWHEVYITSIFSPEQLYREMVPRYRRQTDTYEQLRRRISDLSYFYFDDNHQRQQLSVEMDFYNTIDDLKKSLEENIPFGEVVG